MLSKSVPNKMIFRGKKQLPASQKYEYKFCEFIIGGMMAVTGQRPPAVDWPVGNELLPDVEEGFRVPH
jgi:hypothetical protein